MPTVSTYECVEVCPYCMGENVYVGIDPVKVKYKMQCQHCGKEIALCDECLHADDNETMYCNWHEEGSCGVCFRCKTMN